MAKEFKSNRRQALKNKAFDGGKASPSRYVALPKATTAELSALEDIEASIAFDTTLSEVVINDGSGFSVLAPAASGADTDLSNLTAPTLIDVDLRAATTGTRDIGTSAVKFKDAYFSGSVTASSVSNASGVAIDLTNRTLKGPSNVTAIDFSDPNTGVSLNSKKLVDVANPTLAQDAATMDYVDTAITTAVSKIIGIGGGPSVGGAATEVLTFTGLLATDLIMSVSQTNPGSNNLPLLGFSTQVNNALTCIWSADPGPNAVVVLIVYRP